MTLAELCLQLEQRQWELTIGPAYFLDSNVATIGVQVIVDPDPDEHETPAVAEVVHHEEITDDAILAAARRLVEGAG